jgi:hypothetical protein
LFEIKEWTFDSMERLSLFRELGNGQEAIRSGKLALEYASKLKDFDEAIGNLHLGLATLNLSLLLALQGRDQQSYRRAQEAYDSFRHPTTIELQDRVSYLRIVALDHLLTLSIKLGISSHRLSSLAIELANYVIEAEDSVWEVKDAIPETLPYYRARLLWELYRSLEQPGDHDKPIDRVRLTPIITTAAERLQTVEGQESILVDALIDLDLHLRDVGRADRSLSGRIITATEKWLEVASEEDKDVVLNFLRLPMALVHSASDDINKGAFENATRNLQRAISPLKELGEHYLQARKPEGKKEVQDRAPIPLEDVTQKQVVGYWLYALELQRAVLLHISAAQETNDEYQKKRDQAKRALKICREIKSILSSYPESQFVRARLHNTEAFVEAYRTLGKHEDAKKEVAMWEDDWGASVMNPAYADEEGDVVPVLLSGIWRLTRLKCLLYENAKDADGKAKWEEGVKEMEALMDVEKEEGEDDSLQAKVTAEDGDEVRQQLRQGVLFEAYHPSIWRC